MRAFAFIFASLMALNFQTATANAVDRTRVDAVLARFVDDVMLPRSQQFLDSSLALKSSMEALCKARDAETFSSARQQFGNIIIQWANIEMARTGPIDINNRFERILFYPDRKSTGLRQVRAILAKQDDRALSLATLTKKSVAVQGLGALEFVLFGKGAEVLTSGDGDFRCQYGQTITQNIQQIASAILSEWKNPGGISATWKNPNPDNPLFRNQTEALNTILGLLVNNLRVIHDTRIGAFLRDGADNDRPKSAILRRSQNTFVSIAADLEALQKLFVRSEISSLLPSEMASIAESVNFEFKQAISAANEMDMPIQQALADPEMREKIEYLLLVVKNLIIRINEEFGPATGLSAGFSLADGD